MKGIRNLESQLRTRDLLHLRHGALMRDRYRRLERRKIDRITNRASPAAVPCRLRRREKGPTENAGHKDCRPERAMFVASPDFGEHGDSWRWSSGREVGRVAAQLIGVFASDAGICR
jgi:hypothetical protein